MWRDSRIPSLEPRDARGLSGPLGVSRKRLRGEETQSRGRWELLRRQTVSARAGIRLDLGPPQLTALCASMKLTEKGEDPLAPV